MYLDAIYKGREAFGQALQSCKVPSQQPERLL
jgi:hypothetical protein